ncbi:argininosuccinate lyase [Paenibacillus sp. UNCCL117]|uniref:ATP-grasp domain-containing protein n=1 Tax=unclassified Paenibacillus TaxID=185978 RepID=UPI00088EBE6A|nr:MULTISPECIES: ATP-grasp domain-containing protein [unclassified Paenibacillus]SDC89664.1 argininosuccinate lyase [Paenibacillus sp. cl123]SFW28614.1 argininosuccinate lyase [Paenibacillus sp. UNCCL117]
MAHLLMIESWVGASGNLLPPLLKSLGHTYTFVTRKPEHYQSALSTEKHPVIRFADAVLVTETNDVPSLISFLRPYRFDGVITVCDYYIEAAREVAKAFQLPCPFPDEVKAVRQKHLMRQLLDQAGLDNPDYRLALSWAEAEAAAEAIGYPLVLKPVDLASSAFVSLIQNRQELLEAYEALEAFPLNFRDQERDRTYLLEAYMGGDEVSVESISYKGETTILGITDKSVTGSPYFIENGHMFPAKLTEETDASVKQFVRSALEAVGFDHGIAHTEVKLTAEGPRIVEINPRTAGNYIVELIGRVTGVDLLQAFVELSLGLKPAITPTETGIASAAVMFLVPPQGGTVAQMAGLEELAANEHVMRYKIEDCAGKSISAPIDNACYLGHVIAEDKEGLNARLFAEKALGCLKLSFEPTGGGA